MDALRDLQPFVLSNVRFTGTEIGGGSYGSVEEVIIPGAICAAKKIHEVFLDPSKIPPSGIRKTSTQFVKECKLMSTLRHPHIVQFLGVCFFPDSRLPALVMERLLTSLHDLLEPEIDPPPPPGTPKPFFPLSLKCSILHNVASGLSFLHEQSPPIIHRDLSARNILLNSGMVAKIADLGVARILPRMKNVATMTKAPGASVYMPPEALEDNPEEDEKEQGKTSKYDISIDVFSFGVVSIFTLSQTFPCKLRAPNYRVGNKPIARTELERREYYMRMISRDLREKHPLLQMIEKCLDFAENRPSIREVLSLLEQARDECRDGQMEMNRLELQQALQAQPTIQAELSQHRQQAKQLSDEVEGLKRQVAELRSAVEDSRARRTELQQSLERSERDCNHWKQKSDYVAEIEEARSEIARERGQMMEQLKRQKHELKKLQALLAEKAERDLEYEQSKMKLQSFKEQVRNIKEENGELQSEGRELSIKAANLQKELRVVHGQLRVVTVEKEQLQSTLELTQAQAMVYKEDFETERNDRERAFAERNGEGERYRDEIERLQTLLKSHKGNLKDLEKVHISRQKEMIQVMEELKKAQEDFQAKTSQVEQYKKQWEGLLSKGMVATVSVEENDDVPSVRVSQGEEILWLKKQLEEKDDRLYQQSERVKELERAAAALARTQQHCKSQSKQLLDLQDEAKARDSEYFELQKSLCHLEDYVAEIEESRSEIARERGQLKEQLKRQKLELEKLQAEKGSGR